MPKPFSGPTTQGRQKITMRHGTCNCGCNGTDPWHKKEFVRVVYDVVALPHPEHLSQHMFVQVAEGKFKHPDGVRRAVFIAPCIGGVLLDGGHWAWENCR